MVSGPELWSPIHREKGIGPELSQVQAEADTGYSDQTGQAGVQSGQPTSLEQLAQLASSVHPLSPAH